MNSDIRINVGFFQHHKTKKLIYKLGHEGVTSLLTLWAYAAQNKPKGNLSGMDSLDIALAAGWSGDAERFTSILKDIGFLEIQGETYTIHDWELHNPYAFHAEERSEHARKAARARWEQEDSMQGACGEHARSNAPSPTPTPVPKPTPEPSISFEEFWSAYDYKKNRARCERYWNGKTKIECGRYLNDADREAIMEVVPAYVASQPVKKYRKHPATYLYNSAWEDEITGVPAKEFDPFEAQKRKRAQQ